MIAHIQYLTLMECGQRMVHDGQLDGAGFPLSQLFIARETNADSLDLF
jgi:hypothetical protein